MGVHVHVLHTYIASSKHTVTRLSITWGGGDMNFQNLGGRGGGTTIYVARP